MENRVEETGEGERRGEGRRVEERGEERRIREKERGLNSDSDLAGKK